MRAALAFSPKPVILNLSFRREKCQIDLNVSGFFGISGKACVLLQATEYIINLFVVEQHLKLIPLRFTVVSWSPLANPAWLSEFPWARNRKGLRARH